MKNTLLFIVALITSLGLNAQKGHEIKAKISCLPNKKITLAYHFGDKQYVKQEATSNSQGEVIFKGKEKLATGLYILVFPENKSLEFIVEEQFFTVNVPCTDKKKISENRLELYSNVDFKGSAQNTAFYNYLSFLEQKRKEQKSLQLQIEFYGKSKDFKRELETSESKYEKLNEEVTLEQGKIIAKYKGKMLSRFLLAQQEVIIPERNKQYQDKYGKDWQFHYYKAHYWDNIDFNYTGLLYSPILYNKAIKYIDKLTVQSPDSVFASVDYVIQKAKDNKEAFKFFIVTMLNRYANTKIMCFNAVYVKLVDKYYVPRIADWVDEEQREKIAMNAYRLSITLCGEKAPNILLKKDVDSLKTLYEIEAKYTILVFWQSKGKLRKKTFKQLRTLYKKFSRTDVKVYSVNTSSNVKEWEEISRKEAFPWANIHGSKLFYINKVIYDYYIESTPYLLVLDEDKKIIAKQISVTQISSLLTRLLEKQKK